MLQNRNKLHRSTQKYAYVGSRTFYKQRRIGNKKLTILERKLNLVKVSFWSSKIKRNEKIEIGSNVYKHKFPQISKVSNKLQTQKLKQTQPKQQRQEAKRVENKTKQEECLLSANSQIMRQQFNMTSSTSPFIEKLQNILNVSLSLKKDPKNEEIIRFHESSAKLQILNKIEFERILPKYFRHNKLESFVRQLNWYGFYKTNNKFFDFYSHPDLEKGMMLADIKSRRKQTKYRKEEEERNEVFPSQPIALCQNTDFSSFSTVLPFQSLQFYDSFNNQLPLAPQFSIHAQYLAQDTQVMAPYFGFTHFFN